MIWTQPVPYFPRDELADPVTGEIRLDYRFAVQYPFLRHCWGEPLLSNSVCRSAEHNEGGHPRSLHLMENPVHPTEGTMAADVAWHDWVTERKKLFARMAWVLGWSVGLNPDFCHVDRRADIGLSATVFVYDAWDGTFKPSEVRNR